VKATWLLPVGVVEHAEKNIIISIKDNRLVIISSISSQRMNQGFCWIGRLGNRSGKKFASRVRTVVLAVTRPKYDITILYMI
jgi:hypothetical protein